MRMTPENKDKARAALVDAAGKLFREQGVAATGIDAIARETGQTSGAFYAHFPSKADVFRDAVEAGFARLIGGIKRTGEGGRGARWAGLFAQALSLACPTRCRRPGLPAADACERCRARRPGETHRLFGKMLTEAASRAREGLRRRTTERGEDRAFAILALCAGGLMLARAVPDEATSDRMLKACREAAAEAREGLGWKRTRTATLKSSLPLHRSRFRTHARAPSAVTQPLRSPSSRRRPDRSPRHIPCAGARRTLPPTGCP